MPWGPPCHGDLTEYRCKSKAISNKHATILSLLLSIKKTLVHEQVK